MKRAQRREEARIVKRQTCFCVLFLLCFSVVICLAFAVVVHLFLYAYSLLLFFCFHGVCIVLLIIPAFLYCVYMVVVYVSLCFLFSLCCIMCSVICVSVGLLLCVVFVYSCFPVVLLDYRVRFLLLFCNYVMCLLYCFCF